MPKHVKRLVKAGIGYVEASELVDSTQSYRVAPDKARQRFKDHGYLLLRELIPTNDVFKVCCALISMYDTNALHCHNLGCCFSCMSSFREVE